MKRIKVVDLKVGDKVYLDHELQEVTKVGAPVVKGEGTDPVVEFFYETKDHKGNLHPHTYKFKKSAENFRLVSIANFSKNETIVDKLDKIIELLESKVNFDSDENDKITLDNPTISQVQDVLKKLGYTDITSTHKNYIQDCPEGLSYKEYMRASQAERNAAKSDYGPDSEVISVYKSSIQDRKGLYHDDLTSKYYYITRDGILQSGDMYLEGDAAGSMFDYSGRPYKIGIGKSITLRK